MSFPKFTIFKDSADEFRFNLFAVNGRNILRSSEGYTSKQGCKHGIESTKFNAALTERYRSATSKSDQYYFTLHAKNGEGLGISEMYNSVAARDNGIEAVMRDAPDASVEDLTLNDSGGDAPGKPMDQDESGELITVRTPTIFAGKPITAFDGTSFDLNTAIKVFTESYDPEEPIFSLLDKLVKLPDADKIDTLVIGAWEAAYEKSADLILNKLIEIKDGLKSLKHLFIGDMTYEEAEISWIIQADYTNFWKHFPGLESFGVKGGNNLKFGKIELPNLKHIVIETGGLGKEIIEDLNRSALPNLEYLELWLGTEDYGCTIEISHLKPILNCKFPKLKYLGLKNYYLADDMAKALQGAPTLEGIKILDVSMGTMTDVGAKALYDNEALLQLEYINGRHHFISDEWMAKLAERFAGQNINLDEQGRADDDYVYVEIGE
ncbi:MAG: STM4015 family protein [Saprospiraceae bacterium]|nr:STM4015 family protein [Saprospiraceae bacterium]